jgi:hypothetical protein
LLDSCTDFISIRSNSMTRKMEILNIVILALILLGGVLAFLYLTGNQSSQLLVGIIIAVAYACWGIIYHWMDKTLYRKVVVEYLLISAIAVMVMVVVLKI